MSFSHVSRPVRTVTSNTFARKFITLGRVINYWNDAVGPDLAAKTYPIGMKVHKAPTTKKEKSKIPPPAPASPEGLLRATSPSRGEVVTTSPASPALVLNATLEIAASSADATLIHYQKALILERLRTLLGADMITDIKITHTALPGFKKGALAAPSFFTPKNGSNGAKNPPTPLTDQQKNSLSPVTDGVADLELRVALDALAQSMARPVRP